LKKQIKKTTLLATLADGRTITRILYLEDNNYFLNTETNLAGPWKSPVIHYSFNGPINITEKKINMLMIWPFSMFAGNKGSFNKAVFLGQGDRVTIDRNGKEKNKRIYTNEGSQKIVSDKNKSGKEHFEGDLSWFAVRNKYFMNASIPVEKSLWTAETSYTYDGENSWYDYDISKKISDGNPNIKIYMGPVSFDALTEAGNELTQLMEFSWSFIRPISIAFLWVVKKLHVFISNWGLVLILFSLLVKLALAPLSHKSFVSMQKMASLQPQIADLREKHKSNPQKLQQATMELYKKEGVNPFGGCLPVLLQMPVFFALYPVIDTSFELRQAMFIPNWISDLSRPDPFYILPIAMGLSMYFQSKTTMSKDPNQKMMLYIMPVMMVILFANFSAGLTLYWLMFNIFSFIQQELVKPKMTPSRT
jgi:YidC/Oxa1 family membrane protein insertase